MRMFTTDTSTTDIATLLCCVLRRMQEECGKDFPWYDDDDAMALYCYFVAVMRTQGYVWHDGVIGLRDLATGFPLSFAGVTHHPLRAALPVTRGTDNLSASLPRISTFAQSPGQSTASAAVSAYRLCLPLSTACSPLCNSIRRPLISFEPSEQLLSLQDSNGLHPLEMAILEPGRAARLKDELDEYQKKQSWASSRQRRASAVPVSVRSAGLSLLNGHMMLLRVSVLSHHRITET